MADDDQDHDDVLRQQSKDFAAPALSSSFKPTDGGFIYRAPSAWLFLSADDYFVTAAQRELIITALKRPLPTKIFPQWLVWAMVGCVAITAVGLIAGPALLFPDHSVVGFLAGFAVLIAVGMLSRRRVALQQRSKLQPILALAQPANQGSGFWTRASGVVATPSTPRELLVAGGFNAFMALCLSPADLSIWQGRALSLSDPVSLEPVLAVYFSGAALLNFWFALRGKPSATPKRITAPLAILVVPVLILVLVAGLGDFVRHAERPRSSFDACPHSLALRRGVTDVRQHLSFKSAEWPDCSRRARIERQSLGRDA